MSDLVSVLRDLDQVPVYGAGVRTHAGVSVVYPPPPGQLGRERERAVDPAVRVEHASGHPAHVTTDRIAKILFASLQETGNAEDGKCVLVVQSEGGVVNQTILELEIVLETAKKRQHFESLYLKIEF